MSKEKQIKETRNLREIGCDNAPFEFCNKYDRCEDCPIDRMATALYNAGYRKQSEVVRCKDCNYFMEYTSTYKSEVEKADGDCYIRLMNSENRQYCACQHDDFCSFAKMKGGAE